MEGVVIGARTCLPDFEQVAPSGEAIAHLSFTAYSHYSAATT
jgi:hypothetical protein